MQLFELPPELSDPQLPNALSMNFIAEVGEHETQLFELPPELSVPQLPNSLSMNLLRRWESTRRSCLSCRPSCRSRSCVIPYL